MHKARVTKDIDRRVVSCEPGWWYPEKGGPLYGVWESNINLLTSLDGPYDPAQGTPTLRTMLCKVSRTKNKEIPVFLSNKIALADLEHPNCEKKSLTGGL